MALQHQITQGEKIAQAFGHLFTFDEKKPGVKPETGEGFSGERFGLGNFVFVMRENEVFATGVNIESLS